MKTQIHKDSAEAISTEGNFTLWKTSPTYKTLYCSSGYLRNIKTHENCGQVVELHKHFYKDGILLEQPVYDEDCYEFVRVDEDGNETVYCRA